MISNKKLFFYIIHIQEKNSLMKIITLLLLLFLTKFNKIQNTIKLGNSFNWENYIDFNVTEFYSKRFKRLNISLETEKYNPDPNKFLLPKYLQKNHVDKILIRTFIVLSTFYTIKQIFN